MKSPIPWIAASLALVASSLAQATLVVDWSLAGPDAQVRGSGSLTAELLDPALVESTFRFSEYDADRPQDFYRLTGISGSFGGVAITGLLPEGSFNGNDNLLFLPESPTARALGALSYGGWSFSLADGGPWNLYVYARLGAAPFFEYAAGTSQGDGALDTFDGVMSLDVLSGLPPAPIPLPAAGWMMGAALLGMGLSGRRRFMGAQGG